MFVLAVMPLTFILRKVRPSYAIKIKGSINHPLYMDDLKLYGRNKDDIETLIHTVNIFSDDISMKFNLDICATVTLKDQGIYLAEARYKQ